MSIIAILVMTVIYGVLLGHSKIRTLALSSYVGWVLSSEVGISLYNAVKGLSFAAHTTPSSIRLFLYITPIILLEFSRRKHEPGERAGLIVTLVLSVATAALLVVGYLHQLQTDSLATITGASQIAFAINQFRVAVLVAVPVLILAEAFIKPKDKHH